MKHPLVLLALTSICMAGCAHISRPIATPLSFDGATMTIVGPVHATGVETYVFGIPVSGDSPDKLLQSVKDKALSRYGGDEILNPVIDDDTFSFIGIFSERHLSLSGTVIKYKSIGLNENGTLKFKADGMK